MQLARKPDPAPHPGLAITPTTADPIPPATRALAAAERYLAQIHHATHARCAPGGTLDPTLLDTHQLPAHGYAWAAAYVAILRATLDAARAQHRAGGLSRLAALLLVTGFGEYLAQIGSGIAMSQDEIVRPALWDLEHAATAFRTHPDVMWLAAQPHSVRPELIALLRQSGPAAIVDAASPGSDDDDTIRLVRAQFRAFADDRIAPHAPGWHDRDELIPMPLIDELAALGVFGMTTPAAYGGSEMGAEAMCVVTEELSRGYIGAGSLGTRSEIASELIRLAGTQAQKDRWLPALASGAVLPTAVFTEPNTGSDLANLATRAERTETGWRIFGAKTWITHAARADLMILLARTGGPNTGANAGHRGLSMFLAPKPRGTDADPFPAPGMQGGDIRVLGYRGMREYELAFDGFEIPADALLGGQEGQGFRQLMTTFELARIQTAARALGVAQNALELGFAYATTRRQFARPLIDFPRVAGKLAWMAAETVMVRHLVRAVARLKETGVRCDVEAGMAKLVAARVAWSAADNALQIHGGNGYALEYPISRVLCDARILNIFEGAAEIQAHIIARGLLTRPGTA